MNTDYGSINEENEKLIEDQPERNVHGKLDSTWFSQRITAILLVTVFISIGILLSMAGGNKSSDIQIGILLSMAGGNESSFLEITPRNPEECAMQPPGRFVFGMYNCPRGYFFRNCGNCYKCMTMNCNGRCFPNAMYQPQCDFNETGEITHCFQQDTAYPQIGRLDTKCVFSDYDTIKCCLPFD